MDDDGFVTDLNAPSGRRIITLTTDFGSTDHFVGVMKGVILGISPEAAVVDITHEIPPYAVGEAMFTVAQTYPYFPEGTVHVVVIDPGVGSSRRAVVVEAAGQFFVGPDNGVFSMVFLREECVVREITNRDLMRQDISQTFHGRDVFAPVAAHVSLDNDTSRVGQLIEDYLRSTVGLTPMRTGKRIWTGAILKIDRFGNIVTNFRPEELAADLTLRAFELQVGCRTIETIARSYADASEEVFAIVGSSGYIEVSSTQRSAARLLGVGTGAPVELTIY